MKLHLPFTAAIALSFLAVAAVGQDDDAPKPGMETDWLEFVKGYKGSVMGAEVREVEEGADGKGSRLVIAIPKVAIKGDVVTFG